MPVGAEAYIEGRAVIIPAHNDDAGERSAEAKLRACRGHAGSIKVLRLPGLGEKQDVTDWLESHSLAELQAEIARDPGMERQYQSRTRRYTEPSKRRVR